MPRVVTEGVPNRMPLGLNLLAVSKGIEFRFTVIPTVSKVSCTFFPVRFSGRRSISIRWLSVPPLTNRSRRRIRSSANSRALLTTDCA